MCLESSGKPDAWKLARPVWGWGRGATPRPTPPAKVHDGTDWKSCRPLGISCAATLAGDSDELVLWHGGKDRHHPTDRMSPQKASGLVEYLVSQIGIGYTIVTWNGLGFDFDILAEESGMLEKCRRLANNHVDMMFHALCRLEHFRL